MTSLWSLPWCSTLQGPPSCLQVMVFMGGKVRLPGRGGFSNPDRSAEDCSERSAERRSRHGCCSSSVSTLAGMSGGSAEPLGQSDDDALRAPQEAEPVDV